MFAFRLRATGKYLRGGVKRGEGVGLGSLRECCGRRESGGN